MNRRDTRRTLRMGCGEPLARPFVLTPVHDSRAADRRSESAGRSRPREKNR